jgi:hypothetical protein
MLSLYQILIIILFILLFLGFVSIVYWSYKNGISPMPTSSKVKRTIFKALPTEVSGPIYELGSGWGTLAFPLAAHYPSHPIEAYESSPIPYFFSKARWFLKRHPNLHLHKKDFFTVSLKDASLIVCYLYPGAMRRLKDKFEQELPSNCLVITNTFSIPGWNPIAILESSDIYHTKVYVYGRKGVRSQESGVRSQELMRRVF